MAKVRIPKRVGGVKLPKKVRRKANKALKMAGSPVVRDVAAAALGAAAHARSARPKGDGGLRINIDGDKLADSIRSAALDGIRRFLEGFEEGLRTAGAADSGDEDSPRPARPARPARRRAPRGRTSGRAADAGAE